MIYILLAILSYSAAILIVTFANRAANTAIVTVIINTVSAIIPAFLMIPVLQKGGLHDQKTGFIAALIAGVLVALFAIFLNKSLAVHKVAIVTPMVFGGMIFLTSVLSVFIYKEKISMLQGVGLMFVLLGIAIITYSRFAGK